MFQQLDQRILMAGDTSIAIDAAHSAALIFGFDHLDNFGDRLADTKVAFDGQNSVVATLNHQQSSPLSGERGFSVLKFRAELLTAT